MGSGFRSASGVGVGVAGSNAVGLGVGVRVGRGKSLCWVLQSESGGVGVVASIWTIFATEGTPFEFRMNSMGSPAEWGAAVDGAVTFRPRSLREDWPVDALAHVKNHGSRRESAISVTFEMLVALGVPTKTTARIANARGR